MMKFEIKHRLTGEVKFTAEIEATEETPLSVKIGLAVKWAVQSSANLSSANLRSADLSSANLRSADLRSADLRYADLSSANLRSADLRSADLRYADLRYANLSSADLRSADLRSANLSSADLRSADLRYADLPYIEPMPDLDSRILGIIEKGDGKLNMGDWHTCETTHCRAGWAVTLHPAGKTLESIFGTPAAAALIYNAAYPSLKIPDFYTDNETALADIKSRAQLTPSTTK